jgi:hypothetical protein
MPNDPKDGLEELLPPLKTGIILHHYETSPYSEKARPDGDRYAGRHRTRSGRR